MDCFVRWPLAAAVALVTASSALAESATFDVGTGVLTIPELVVAADTFRNVRFQLGADGKLSLVGFQGAVAAACTLEHINFTKYRSLPPFGTVVTTSQLDDIIGCRGATSTAPFESYAWTLSTSTATCRQYIYVELAPAANNQTQVIGWGIRGINSDTNQPYPCSN